MRKVMMVLLTLMLLSGFGVLAQEDASQSNWWNDRVFYEVFVRSFYDSDGDGIGDLRGVIEKLDYLNDGNPDTTDDLGITGIWLMPIMESPSYHGYDVMNYYKVNTDYGTNEDFKDLMDAAHERGIAVIVDLVLNHTSSRHPYYLDSMNGFGYEDWYIWQEEEPNFTRGPWGQQIWHIANGRYFYGVFWSGMPDLNYDNPAVTDEMYNVSRYWLEEMGADGFRLDAIKYLIEDGAVVEDTPSTLDWFSQYHNFVTEAEADVLLVGEAWDTTNDIVPYVGGSVDIVFEFDLATSIIRSANTGNASTLINTYATVLEAYPQGQFATFLTNHDQDRIMSQLREDTGKAKVAASVLLTGPGVPFLYYGEEVGMVGVKPDERIRTPMHWDGTADTAGFTSGGVWEELAAGYEVNNVSIMKDDEQSLLNHYRTLIHIRNEQPALRLGDMTLIESDNESVFSFIRQTVDDTLLVIINLSDEAVVDYTLTLDDDLTGLLDAGELLFGDGSVETLAPQSTYILKLG